MGKSWLRRSAAAFGLAKQPEYQERAVDLRPGDRLYIYTDGLLEAADENGDEFGAERLSEEILRGRDLSLEASVEALEVSAKGWSRGRLDDDLSILALEIGHGDREQVDRGPR